MNLLPSDNGYSERAIASLTLIAPAIEFWEVYQGCRKTKETLA